MNGGRAGNREAQPAWPLGGITKDITAATKRHRSPVQVLAGGRTESTRREPGSHLPPLYPGPYYDP